MATFSYVALEPSGKRKTGYVDALDRETAITSVASSGKFVLEITESAGISAKASENARRGKITRADLAMFTRRLADLATAGLPLDRVLQVLSEQSESQSLSDVAQEALADVRTGMPVSAALAKHPRYFAEVYTETLRAGEASGQFGEVATKLADFQEQEVARRSQIMAALTYPIVLLCMAVGVVIFLLTFVVPRLSQVFEGLGNDLPVTTKMLFAFTGFLTHYGLYILGALIVGFFFFRAWTKTDSGALARDRALITMPLIGKVVQKAVVSRFTRVLGTLVYGGVPILEALELSGLAAGNRVFRDRSKVVQQEVREGKPIAEAMRDAGEFPPVLTHMVAVGEETGDLPKMLGRVANSLDFEVETAMRRLTALAEPLIVVGMGGVVGFVVLSVLLPIFQAQELVK